MTELRIVIPGPPKAWQRARAGGALDGNRRFEQSSQKEAKWHIRGCMAAALLQARRWDPAAPMGVSVHVFRRRKVTAVPDCDNYFKLIADSGNGLVWIDDAQIVEPHGAHKWDSRELGCEEHTLVTVWEVDLEARNAAWLRCQDLRAEVVVQEVGA